MTRIDYGPAQRRRSAHFGSTALRPIKGELLETREKALFISTPLRRVWVPRKLVTHDPQTSIFLMPNWLAEAKCLD